MYTVEELLECESIYKGMEDLSEQDWERMDMELEKYENSSGWYDLKKCDVLLFVLQQVHQDYENYLKVPAHIRHSPAFDGLAAEFNEELKKLLFWETSPQIGKNKL